MPDIECQWMRDRRLVVNPDGQVLPCCYFANSIYIKVETGRLNAEYAKNQHWPDGSIKKIKINADVLKDYYKEKDKYNIFKRPLKDIINDDWFTKTLPESWENEEKTCNLCIKHCSKRG